MVSLDERQFNFRRRPSLLRKIRVLGMDLSKNYSFGVTIPKDMAVQFSGCNFMIYVSGNSIILQSGCRLAALELRKKIEKDEVYRRYNG